MDLLHNQNQCGKNLLKLVAKGNSILAELQRLVDYIPGVIFIQPFLEIPPPESEIYLPLVLDFKDLTQVDDFEDKLQSNSDLSELDDVFRETYITILERFYQLFENIYKYYKDYSQFLQDLQKGSYVQHHPENLMQDRDGKRLMSEALYLWGVMLYLTEMLIPGIVRERILLSFYRYKGHSVISSIDYICQLFRKTSKSDDRKNAWIEDYFNRFKLPEDIIVLIITTMKDDDIYNQLAIFPSPEHRAIALQNQSAMLFIIMFFYPRLLHSEGNRMREIVDKFFGDSWVVPYYLGYTADLLEIWQPYESAKQALTNYTLDVDNIQKLQQKHVGKVRSLNKVLNSNLKEGILTEEYVLSNLNRLFQQMRECNSTLRWLLLHRRTKVKRLLEIVDTNLNKESLVQLLMNTSQFEEVMKEKLQLIIGQRLDIWNEDKYQASVRMYELSEFFSGNRPLARGVQRNDNYVSWFSEMSKQIDGLDFEETGIASRKIQQLIQALEDIEQYQQIEDNLQIKAFLAETRDYLKHMINVSNLNDDIMAKISKISDFSYAWFCMEDFLEILQEFLRREPRSVLYLKSTIIKLSSILYVPLTRILQSGSNDFTSVSEYYSKLLVNYVKKVLQSIPQAIFDSLDSIASLHASKIPEITSKIKRDHLKDLACLEERFLLAQYCHQVAVFTQGILQMEKTLIGIIEVDPRQILKEGIRKELLEKLASTIKKTLHIPATTSGQLQGKLDTLALQLSSLRSSLEHIQDFLGIYALKIWQDQLTKLINYNTDLEAQSLIALRQTFTNDDETEIIPKVESSDGNSITFMGQLLRQFINLCDAKQYIYIEWMHGWYDSSGIEIMGLDLMTKLHKCFGVLGLSGLEKLLSCATYNRLKALSKQYKELIPAGSMDSYWQRLQPTSNRPLDGRQVFSQAINKLEKVFDKIAIYIVRIGQMQLMRRLIAYELNFTGRTESPLIWSALMTLNKSILNDIKYDQNLIKTEDPVIQNLEPLFNQMGFNSPLEKIFLRPGQVWERLPLVLALFTMKKVSLLKYDPVSGYLKNDTEEALDCCPIAAGILTLLRQFHEDFLDDYIGYIAQFINIGIANSKERKDGKIPAEVTCLLVYLEEFRKFASLSRIYIEKFIPAFLQDKIPTQ